MTWDYRVVKYDLNKNVVYRIHEVYYDKSGAIEGFTEEAVFPQGESLDELISDLKLMITDAQKKLILSLKELQEKFGKE